jgi:hypothetical protein
VPHWFSSDDDKWCLQIPSPSHQGHPWSASSPQPPGGGAYTI